MFPTTSSKNEPKTSGAFTRQGSLRKVLPAQENKENLFGKQNEDLNNIFKIFRQEYIILAEYNRIGPENLQGVYVIPSRENPLIWFGVIFVRKSYYKDAIFRFTTKLDDNFPDGTHPVIFQSKLFHPVIHPETNELNLLGAFPNWNKNEQHLWQVMKYIQWIFMNVEATLPHGINEEACKMLKEQPEIFAVKANEYVELSKNHLYDVAPTEDKHYIIFEKFNAEIHKKENLLSFVQEKILDDKEKSGYSWVLPRRFKSLERSLTPTLEDESKVKPLLQDLEN